MFRSWHKLLSGVPARSLRTPDTPCVISWRQSFVFLPLLQILQAFIKRFPGDQRSVWNACVKRSPLVTNSLNFKVHVDSVSIPTESLDSVEHLQNDST